MMVPPSVWVIMVFRPSTDSDDGMMLIISDESSVVRKTYAAGTEMTTQAMTIGIAYLCVTCDSHAKYPLDMPHNAA